MSDVRDRLIVALDVSSASRAQQIVASLGETTSIYKVGKQLFTAEGPRAVQDVIASGRNVFLDLKFHDIPNTVARAVTEAARLGVSMLTVHASGGSKMLRAAAEAAAAAGTPPLVLAVTVLTSLSEEDLRETGIASGVLEQALRLAALARAAGCSGVISSAREAQAIRKEMGPDFVIVTPGVRPEGEPSEDQARVVTPAEAMAAGASHIVVGRPIVAASDPAAAARAILQQMETALGSLRVPAS